MDLSDDDLDQIAEADRRVVDPPIKVDTATWSKAGQLDWWVKERLVWFGRVRGQDGRQRWVRADDLRLASKPAPPSWTGDTAAGALVKPSISNQGSAPSGGAPTWKVLVEGTPGLVLYEGAKSRTGLWLDKFCAPPMSFLFVTVG